MEKLGRPATLPRPKKPALHQVILTATQTPGPRIEAKPDAQGTSARGQRTREAWNGTDWYVSFGQESGSRNWEDARKYGFVSAGGGEWYSRSLKNLPIGARVFVCIPKNGYVGIGTVTGEAARFSEALVPSNGVDQKLAELPLTGTYQHDPAGDTDEAAEYVVPIQWQATVAAHQAVWKTGMFANQNSACKLSKPFTIDTVVEALGVTTESSPTQSEESGGDEVGGHAV